MIPRRVSIIEKAWKSISGWANLASGKFWRGDSGGVAQETTPGNLSAGTGITISAGSGTGALTNSGATIANSDTGSGAVATHNVAYTHTDIALNTAARHAAVTIGADGEHSLATQVLSGVDAAAAQKGHIQLAGELGGTASSPTVAATHSGSAHHTRSHTITGTSDHTSSATSGQMLKADASGLPVDASNTNAEVAAAISVSHARSHAINGASDHTGFGDSVTKNVGTTAGTLAAGDHTHSGTVDFATAAVLGTL